MEERIVSNVREQEDEISPTKKKEVSQQIKINPFPIYHATPAPLLVTLKPILSICCALFKFRGVPLTKLTNMN